VSDLLALLHSSVCVWQRPACGAIVESVLADRPTGAAGARVWRRTALYLTALSLRVGGQSEPPAALDEVGLFCFF
jgi:hypothetical protein